MSPSGEVPSGAEVAESALERMTRQLMAERDAGILGEQGVGDDLDQLVDWSLRTFDPGD